jgi:uncharacterized membrane protein
MGLLSSTRSIGVIGSIMIILLIFPGIGALLAIVGWVLVLVATYQLSNMVGARGIFNNALIAAVLGAVGVVALTAIAVSSVLNFLSTNGMSLGSLVRMNRTSLVTSNLHGFGPLAIGVITGLALLWVFLIASAFFLRRSYNEIAGKFSIRMFSTAALVYLIGAALTIIGVGLLVVFIGEILQAIAFYSLPDVLPGQAERPVPMTVPPPPPQQF